MIGYGFSWCHNFNPPTTIIFQVFTAIKIRFCDQIIIPALIGDSRVIVGRNMIPPQATNSGSLAGSLTVNDGSMRSKSAGYAIGQTFNNHSRGTKAVKENRTILLGIDAGNDPLYYRMGEWLSSFYRTSCVACAQGWLN